jgi:hypothetical protein
MKLKRVPTPTKISKKKEGIKIKLILRARGT